MFGSITTDTITIDGPPAVVWAVYTDIEHWSEWTASVTTARLDPSGPLALGSRASIKQPRFPQVTWTVTDIEPERSWRWANHSVGAHTTADHRLTPLDDGRTQCRPIDRSTRPARPTDRLAGQADHASLPENGGRGTPQPEASRQPIPPTEHGESATVDMHKPSTAAPSETRPRRDLRVGSEVLPMISP